MYLERHLVTWARWMRSGEWVAGHSHSSAVISSGGASEHFDDMLEATERRIAKVTDSVIADLANDQRAAIHHAYLHAVYRLKNYMETLEAGRQAVALGLRRRGVWMGE